MKGNVKTLMLMRHAKAAWPPDVDDFDRPLAERGHEQAPEVGRWMLENSRVPDYILTSSALRTRQTTTWVSQELGELAPTAKLEDGLYGATGTEIIVHINHVPETVRSLLVVTHMPGVQDAAMRLASAQSDEDSVLDLAGHYPTAALTVMNVTKPWAELDGRDADVMNFYAPR